MAVVQKLEWERIYDIVAFPSTVYAIWYILRGSYFREFCESGVIREFNNTRKYLPPIRPDAWMWLVYAILVIQYTVHMQRRIATFAFWKWVIAPLLDREFNHSRKCLEVPIREKLDSQNVLLIQYGTLFSVPFHIDVHVVANCGFWLEYASKTPGGVVADLMLCWMCLGPVSQRVAINRKLA